MDSQPSRTKVTGQQGAATEKMQSERSLRRLARRAPGSAPPARPRDRAREAIGVVRRPRTVLASFRLQLLGGFVAVLALATIASVLLVRQVLLQRVDARVQAELGQEVAEIIRLASGIDPATSEPFGTDVARVFDIFLARNIPSRAEFLATFVDGTPHGRTGELPAPLDPREFAAQWATVEDVEDGHVDTPAGRIDYLAVPFRAGGEPVGVFVVAIHTEALRADAEAATIAAGSVGLVMLVIGSLLAGRLADRILRPVALVTRTARSISESDLTRRIPVRGHDEISELADTFNQMLGRLESSFAAQRRFLDDAGHELRTPITIIRGHLEVMGDDPEDRARALAVVHDELDRVTRLVDDLLTLAAAGRPDFLRVQPTDVARLTGRMVEAARGLDDRPWTLDGVARVEAVLDPQRLTEAVLQLAENAARYAPPGSSVGIGSSAEPGWLRFWVRDRGPGVSDDERDRIFDRFHRGAASRRTEGSGVGLSIVAAIAEAHGGRAGVQSPPSEGATFTISIPLRLPA